jgi:hypothetical protein
MAIRRREKRSTWLWLVAAAVAVAAVAWWLMAGAPRTELADAPPPVHPILQAPGEAMTPAVAEFVRFVTEGRTRADLGIDHLYAADGLRQLAAALEEMAGAHAGTLETLRPQLDEMRRRADALQREPAPAQQPQHARSAFGAAAAALNVLQQRRGVQPDVAEPVRVAAGELSEATALVDQAPRVQAFFEAAADAVMALGTARA